jgi:hypothetical protein
MTRFQLVGTETTTTGVAILTYRRIAEPAA